MKNSILNSVSFLSDADQNSEKILLEKMGMSRKEIREVYNKYGVGPAKLVELMQLSKYQFIYSGRVAGQCEPCMMVNNWSRFSY